MRRRTRDTEAPFVPRWTWRALRADRRRNRRGETPSMLPFALALGVSMFCFLRVFMLLGGVVPAADGFAGMGAKFRPVVEDGMQASLWMVFAAISLGVAGMLLDSEWVPKVRLKPGALRLTLDARPAHLRPPPPADPAKRAADLQPTPPLAVKHVDPSDVVAAMVRPRRPAAALSGVALAPSWLSAEEAAGARALASLCAAFPASIVAA